MGQIIQTTNLTKLTRLKNAEKLVGKLFNHHNIYHWFRVLSNGYKIEYWPTTNRWQYKGNQYKGTPQNILNLIQREEA